MYKYDLLVVISSVEIQLIEAISDQKLTKIAMVKTYTFLVETNYITYTTNFNIDVLDVEYTSYCIHFRKWTTEQEPIPFPMLLMSAKSA